MANQTLINELLDTYGNEYGDVLRSSITTTFSNINDGDLVETVAPRYEKSEFIRPDDLEKFMCDRKNEFTIFSMNVNSIEKKYPQLSLFIENLLSKNAGFSVITLQEARIYDETYKKIDKVTVTDTYQIPGYNMFTRIQLCNWRTNYLC